MDKAVEVVQQFCFVIAMYSGDKNRHSSSVNKLTTFGSLLCVAPSVLSFFGYLPSHCLFAALYVIVCLQHLMSLPFSKISV